MNVQHITGLSLDIVLHGKLVMAKGYGLSNIEHNIPASAKTVYKIGSVSKQMVAAVIMYFMQEGKVKLTDSLPLFFKGSPISWNKITIRHLLNHTSGLPRESPLSDNMKVQPDSDLIKAAYKTKLLFEPGTSWQYCNLGYFMLVDIIRQLSGKSFAAYMENDVFKTFNLLQTQTTTSSGIVKNRAGGYVYKSRDTILNAKDYQALRPSGAFLSSVGDLVKWEMLIQNNKLLKAENWSNMWTDTVRTSSSNKAPIEYYGYGWYISNYKNLKVVHHDGTLPGFTSSYFRFIESRSAIIILTNADNAYPKTIALGIADILLNNGALQVQ
jgi:CubicO group peptidase (beta-lactamase class C family)